MTLGCGGWGGNITSDNISPRHLLNLKRVAYGIRPAVASPGVAPGRPTLSAIPAARRDPPCRSFHRPGEARAAGHLQRRAASQGRPVPVVSRVPDGAPRGQRRRPSAPAWPVPRPAGQQRLRVDRRGLRLRGRRAPGDADRSHDLARREDDRHARGSRSGHGEPACSPPTQLAALKNRAKLTRRSAGVKVARCCRAGPVARWAMLCAVAALISACASAPPRVATVPRIAAARRGTSASSPRSLSRSNRHRRRSSRLTSRRRRPSSVGRLPRRPRLSAPPSPSGCPSRPPSTRSWLPRPRTCPRRVPETAQAVVDDLGTRDFDIEIPLNDKVLAYRGAVQWPPQGLPRGRAEPRRAIPADGAVDLRGRGPAARPVVRAADRKRVQAQRALAGEGARHLAVHARHRARERAPATTGTSTSVPIRRRPRARRPST